MVLLKEAQEH